MRTVTVNLRWGKKGESGWKTCKRPVRPVRKSHINVPASVTFQPSGEVEALLNQRTVVRNACQVRCT